MNERVSTRTVIADLKEALPLMTALVAVASVVGYALLAYLCSWLYKPIGVTPAEVGLDQGTLFVRTGAALVGLAIPIVTVSGVVLLICVLVVVVVSLGGRGNPTVRPVIRVVPAVVAVAVFVAAAIILYRGARHDKDRLVLGQSSVASFYGQPAPWKAEVVSASWADSPHKGQIRLPRCLLHLGQKDGNTVLYDARPKTKRALRIPTAKLVIEVFPDADSALTFAELTQAMQELAPAFDPKEIRDGLKEARLRFHPRCAPEA
jgi:hypothetical protein